MNTRPHTIAALAAAIALTFTLAACGGGDDTATGSDTTGTTITETTTGTDTTATDTTGTDTTGTDTTDTTDTTGTDTTGTDATAGVTDACSILTRDQIASATGTTPTISEPEDDGRRCNFGVVTTWVGFGEDWIRSTAEKGESLSVGDSAAHDPRFHQVYVKSGATTFNIKCNVCSGSTDEQKAALVKMAEDAIANIG